MTFSESRKDWRRRIGDRAAADLHGIATTPPGSPQRLRDRHNASGIATTRQGSAITPQGSAITAEIGNDAAGIVDIATKVNPC